MINHKTVLSLMRQLGLSCKIRVKKYRSYNGQFGKKVKNLLLDKIVDKENHKTYYIRNFNTTKPNQIWVTDITEFKIFGTKIYLSPIIDLFDKNVLTYTISKTPSLMFVKRMLNEAIKEYKPDKNLIFHSDQGWQYQNEKIQDILKKKDIKQSMSQKGNCYDNSLAENFFSHLKAEFFYQEDFKSVEDFIIKLKKYIDYYCKDRISLKLKGMTPMEYRQSYLKIA